MEELIAKRYIKAIKKSFDGGSIELVASVFSVLAQSFKDEKFIAIINNPDIDAKQKSEILLTSIKSVNSKEIDNLIKLLAENNRLNILPAIAEGFRKDLALSTRTYTGIIYSDSDLGDKVIQDLSSGISKKFDSSITLTFIKNNFNGIKVSVEDLGVEIDFSKSKITNQIIEHILKAI
jgi:F-type H+-transporting ATPase subunit delta